jgi:hypothetical protein
MKINTKLWITITLISAVIILLKNYDLSIDKKYLFDRTMSGNTSLTEIIDVKTPKISNMAKITNKLICDFQLKKYDSIDNLCEMSYYDINSFNNSNKFTFRLPKNAQIEYCNKENVFYINKYELSAYYIKNKKHQNLNLANFKIYTLIDLGIDSSKLLIFGQYKVGSHFQTGFYLFDLNTKIITPSKIIETNKLSKASENLLIYSGKFSIIDTNTISYCCGKLSKIFFFNVQGDFIKELITKDKSPKATLVTNTSGTFFKRGSAFNTNSAVLKLSDKLLVFSSRTNEKNVIMVDTYSYKTNSYLSSSEILYKNKSSTDIYLALCAKKKVILFFDEGISLFSLSIKNVKKIH